LALVFGQYFWSVIISASHKLAKSSENLSLPKGLHSNFAITYWPGATPIKDSQIDFEPLMGCKCMPAPSKCVQLFIALIVSVDEEIDSIVDRYQLR
jgi:hypothetical protein